MIQAPQQRKILQTIRSSKCQRKECLSSNLDCLDVAWFGNKYQNKQITCSSCILRNDYELSRLEPVESNLMPLSGFLKKFILQYNSYQKLKGSKEWKVKINQQFKVQIMGKLQKFQEYLSKVLTDLLLALQGFILKIIERSNVIFTMNQFQQILKQSNQNSFQKLFNQLDILINKIHRVGQDSFKFTLQHEKNLKNAQIKLLINGVINRTKSVLQNLEKTIKQKTEDIIKI